MDNLYELERKYDRVDVDSAIIPKILAKEKPAVALEQLSGAYALIWHDNMKDRLFVARNAERPLFLVETTDTYILASEELMAHWILDRNDQVIIKSTLIKVGVIYEFLWNKANKLQIIQTKFTPKEKKVYSYLPNYYSKHQQQYQQPATPQTQLNLPIANNMGDLIGKEILFNVTKIHTLTKATTFSGTTVDYPHYKVEVTTFQEVPYNLYRANYVYTTVKYINTQTGTLQGQTLEIADALVFSGNGKLLTDKIRDELDGQVCSCCGSHTRYYDETYVTYDQATNKHTFECVDCAWENHSEEMTAYAMEANHHYYAA